MFLARSSRWPIKERTKIRINTSIPSLYNRRNHATYRTRISSSCLSQSTASRAGTCSPAKPTRIRAPNALRLIRGSPEASDSMACTVHQGDPGEFSPYEQLTSTSPDVLRGLQMGLISMRGGMYSRLNSWLSLREWNG